MEYYHNLVTKKSFELLQALRQKYKFIIIGGWAVFLWTKSLKSKDIDIVVDFPEMEKIRKNYQIFKNERLKKYEAKVEETDIDIYVYHYSDPGLPAEELQKYQVVREGFVVPRPEILLVLKQQAYNERRGTPKGEKDKIDIFSLISSLPEIDFGFYKNILRRYSKGEFGKQLSSLLSQTTEVSELDLNKYKISRLKKDILKKLI